MTRRILFLSAAIGAVLVAGCDDAASTDGGDGGGGTGGAAGGSGGGGGAIDTICGQPGDLGTEKGIGKFCDSIDDCSDTVDAPVCAILGDPRAHFCTTTCTQGGAGGGAGAAGGGGGGGAGGAENPCGTDAVCECGDAGCGCTPISCLD
jgi:hypothetical protein